MGRRGQSGPSARPHPGIDSNYFASRIGDGCSRRQGAGVAVAVISSRCSAATCSSRAAADTRPGGPQAEPPAEPPAEPRALFQSCLISVRGRGHAAAAGPWAPCCLRAQHRPHWHLPNTWQSSTTRPRCSLAGLASAKSRRAEPRRAEPLAGMSCCSWPAVQAALPRRGGVGGWKVLTATAPYRTALGAREVSKLSKVPAWNLMRPPPIRVPAAPTAIACGERGQV